MLYFLYTSKHGDHDNNKRGLLLQTDHFCSNLHILPAKQAIATLKDGDKLVAPGVFMKLMDGKTRLGDAVYVENPQFFRIPIKQWGN